MTWSERVVLVLCLVLMSTCAMAYEVNDDSYWYVELGIAHKLKAQQWFGDTPTKIAIGHRWSGSHLYGEIEMFHLSNIDRGAPFNSLRESWIDTVGGTIGWRW